MAQINRTTHPSTTDSPKLSDVPPEIRLKIYDYLLDNADRFRKRIILCPPKQQSDVSHPIARVNRRIREEAIPALFGDVTIVAYILHSVDLDFCGKWIDAVDEYALRWISSFQLRTPWNWCDAHGRIFGCHECAHAIVIDLRNEHESAKLVGEDGRALGQCSLMESHCAAVERIRAIVKALERVKGRPQMSKDSLHEILQIVGGIEKLELRESA